jgi:hypothetical protein
LPPTVRCAILPSPTSEALPAITFAIRINFEKILVF